MQFATSSKLTLLKKLHHETYEKKYPQVSHFWKMPLSNQAISSLTNGLSLPHISFCTLKKNEWLDDNVMNYALHMISLRNESIFVLDSFLCTSILNGTQKKTKRVLSKVNLQAKKFIMGAYNKNGYHWNLLFLDVHTGELMLIDPQGHREEETSAACKSMKEFFNAQESALSCINWKPCCVSHSFQTDSSSCGIFVLQIAKSLISGLPLTEKTVTFENTLENMEKLRWQWAHEILSTSILGRLLERGRHFFRKEGGNVKMHFPTTANPREEFSSLREEEEKSPVFDTNDLLLSFAAAISNLQSIEVQNTVQGSSIQSRSNEKELSILTTPDYDSITSHQVQSTANPQTSPPVQTSLSCQQEANNNLVNALPKKKQILSPHCTPNFSNGDIELQSLLADNPWSDPSGYYSSLIEEVHLQKELLETSFSEYYQNNIESKNLPAELSVDAQQVEDAWPTLEDNDRVEQFDSSRAEQAFIEQNQPNNDQSSMFSFYQALDILEINQKPLKRKQENIFKSPEGNDGPKQKKMLLEIPWTTPAQLKETNYANRTHSLACINNLKPIAPKTPNMASVSTNASTSQPHPTDKAKKKNKRDKMNESSRKSRAKKKAEREEIKNKIDRLEGEIKLLKEKIEQLKEWNSVLKQTSLPALVSEEALNQSYQGGHKVPDQGGHNVGDCESFGPVQSKSSCTNLSLSHDHSGIHRSELLSNKKSPSYHRKTKGLSMTPSAVKSRKHRAKVCDQDAVDKDNLRRLSGEKQHLTDELNRLKAEHVLLTKK